MAKLLFKNLYLKYGFLPRFKFKQCVYGSLYRFYGIVLPPRKKLSLHILFRESIFTTVSDKLWSIQIYARIMFLIRTLAVFKYYDIDSLTSRMNLSIA